ncbi:MAG: SMI1/KNR4 family protein [Nocardioides sp.]|nr:SMI1/KNR4 family protein [Nocardioides sp.]
MTATEDLQRIARDRAAPINERVGAIGTLAEAVEPALAARAALWRDVLHEVLFDETDAAPVRVAAAHAAASVGGVAVNNLCASTSPDKPEIRRAIVAALHAIGQQPLSEYMEGRLEKEMQKLSNGLTVLPFVNLTLAFGADPRIVPVLRAGLEDEQVDVRASAVLQFAQIGELRPATEALGGPEEGAVRATSADAIGHYWTGDSDAISALQDAAGDDDPKVAKAAKAALRRLRVLEFAQPPQGLAQVPTPVIEIDPRFPWSELLRRWSRELCADEAFALTQDDEVVESGWTGADPVGEEELLDLERRLGRSLPPSYRSFLMTTNGYVGGGSGERIRPACEVKPFTVDEGEWVDVWLDTAGDGTPLTMAEHVATRGEDVVHARWELLSDAIQVSDAHDGAVYLLCPSVTDPEGEWEAWLFANWLPGAARYASWWDLIDAEHLDWESR